MGRDIAALLYLEYRQILNRIVATARQPGRALVYLLAAGYFIFIGFARSHGVVPGSPAARALAEPYASALMFAYITLLGIVCYGAASGIAGAFSSPADARFLIGSHIAEPVVVVWLQLRRSASSVFRVLFSVIVIMVFSGSGTSRGMALAFAGGAILATATAVPMLKLRSVVGTRTAQSFAGAIAAIGILPLSVLLSSLVSNALLHGAQSIERLGFGGALNALLFGKPAALAALYGASIALLGISLLIGKDLYPELYASSLRAISFRERQRQGGTAAFSMEHTYVRRESGALAMLFDRVSGPWTIAWKEWIAFLRSGSMQRLFALGAFGCAAGGALFGAVSSHTKDPLAASISISVSAANIVVIFVAMGSAIGLGSDLRKPLWWMGPDPLWMRLFAWIVGTSWRLAICLSVGLTAWSLTMHQPVVALAGVPLALASVLYLRAVGLALYALFPSSVDQRGPLAMVRALLTYALAAPPAVAGIATGVIFHAVEAGVAAAVLTSAAETIGLIAFASARISGRGVAFAQAEAM